MNYMISDLDKVKKDILEDLSSLTALEIKNKYLSTKGILTTLFHQIKDIKPEERSEFGKQLNELKKDLESKIEDKQISETETVITKIVDPTAPFDINTSKDKRPRILDLKGSSHPLMQELEKMLDIFQSMGFDVLESRQLDDDFHMFESLNFPKGHPARDMYDTFWTEDGLVLPAHTSTMQNRALKMFGPPPIAVVLPGRCFRNEATDASHEHTFHQIEGVYVDKDISMGNMIATIKTYLERYLNAKLEVRIQPAYFPFTEPDCEFVISCPFCNKTGCSTCGHTGWIEIMGCGMIHPNVLKEADIDPEEYTGFAWGFGVDRLTMIKLGIKDIRLLRDSNLNFLRQF